MSPVTIRGLQRQYTVHRYGTVPRYLHYTYHLDGTLQTAMENRRNKESNLSIEDGCVQEKRGCDSRLAMGLSWSTIARCQGCPIHSCWCELRPRPVIFCMFPITEPCRPCAQFCGVRGHMSMIYLGVNLLQVGSRTSAEAQQASL